MILLVSYAHTLKGILDRAIARRGQSAWARYTTEHCRDDEFAQG